MTTNSRPSLRITAGRKVGTFTDATSGSPCNQTSYSPAHLQANGEEYLFNQGGYIDRPIGAPPLGDPERFADKGYLRKRLIDGNYDDPYRILSAWSFPANKEPKGILKLEEHVGSISGMQPLVVGDTIYLFCIGTVSDPFCCTEAVAVPNQYSALEGSNFSCINPYPYGLPFLFKLEATSLDSDDFELIDFGWHKFLDNQTLAASFAYLNIADADKKDGFKGIMSCHAAVYDIYSGWIYLLFEMWRTVGQSQFVMRFGNGDKRQVWNGGSNWDNVVDGALPDWINGANTWQGNPWAHIVSHATTQHIVSGSKYLLMACPADIPEVSFSDDTGDPLTRWNPESLIDLGPFTSTPMSDCHYFERNGKPKMYGVIRDSRCSVSAGPYPGREVWEFDLELF